MKRKITTMEELESQCNHINMIHKTNRFYVRKETGKGCSLQWRCDGGWSDNVFSNGQVPKKELSGMMDAFILGIRRLPLNNFKDDMI